MDVQRKREKRSSGSLEEKKRKRKSKEEEEMRKGKRTGSRDNITCNNNINFLLRNNNTIPILVPLFLTNIMSILFLLLQTRPHFRGRQRQCSTGPSLDTTLDLLLPLLVQPCPWDSHITILTQTLILQRDPWSSTASTSTSILLDQGQSRMRIRHTSTTNNSSSIRLNST